MPNPHDPSPSDQTTSSSPATAPPVVKPPTPLLPELTKETWDYLELRLWNSFSKKIWLLVGGLATVLGLLATLGLNSWIQSKVDAAVSTEKGKFDKVYADHQAKSEAGLVISSIAFHIRLREVRDVEQYVAMVEAFKRRYGEETSKAILSSNDVSDLLWPIKEYGSFSTPKSEVVKKAAAAIAKSTNAADPAKLQESLTQLANASSHIVALREMASNTERLMFSEIKADPGRLVKLYEDQILPKYFERLKKTDAPRFWLSSGERKVNSLFPSGQNEFSFYIPNYFDKVLASDDEKK